MRDRQRDVRQRDKPAEPAPPPPQICFHGAPPAELQGPRGGLQQQDGGHGAAQRPPHGNGITGLAQPQSNTPGMCPPPCHHPEAGASTRGAQHHPSVPPGPSRRQSESVSLWVGGFPSHIFCSPSEKQARGARPPPGAAPSTGCSPREEEESWGRGRRKACVEGTA